MTHDPTFDSTMTNPNERRGAGLDLVNRFYVRVGLIAGGIGLTSVPLSRVVPWGHSVVTAILVALLLAFVLAMVIIICWERRLVSRLKASNYRLCPRCGYNLAGHTNQVSCPECGTVYEIEDIEARWRAFRPRISGFLDGASES